MAASICSARFIYKKVTQGVTILQKLTNQITSIPDPMGFYHNFVNENNTDRLASQTKKRGQTILPCCVVSSCGRVCRNASQEEYESNRLDLYSTQLSDNYEAQQEIGRSERSVVQGLCDSDSQVYILHVRLVFNLCSPANVPCYVQISWCHMYMKANRWNVTKVPLPQRAKKKRKKKRSAVHDNYYL